VLVVPFTPSWDLVKERQVISHNLCASRGKELWHWPLKTHHGVALRQSLDLELVNSFEALEEILATNMLEDRVRVDDQTHISDCDVQGEPSTCFMWSVKTKTCKLYG
jgi:hypothetical protein